MFQRLLDARIKELWSFYEATGELSHQGEKGILREAFMRKLLEAMLPHHFGVGSGIIVDKWGRQSSQIDLLVYDKRNIPPLLEQNGHGIYPFDAVMRVVEVKSTLTRDDLLQFKKSVWALNPFNPNGLKVGAVSGMEGRVLNYPLVGLYAYDTRVADIRKTASGVGVFDNQGLQPNNPEVGLCCIATRGVFLGNEFVPRIQLDMELGNLVHNTRLFLTILLNGVEQTASTRKEFGLSEWLLPFDLTDKAGTLTISVAHDDWGGANEDSITAVLGSVAAALCHDVPMQASVNMLVRRTYEDPTLSLENGLTIVQLNVNGCYWSQFIYQFANVICRILCHNGPNQGLVNPNSWFEMVLGETASLFVLRKLAVAWKSMPPFPDLDTFAPNLAVYALDITKKAKVGKNKTFIEWFSENENDLRTNPILDEKKSVVAAMLLPMFEATPFLWGATTYLNMGKHSEEKSFASYLNDWHSDCPPLFKKFVAQLALLFGVKVESV